MNAPVIEASGLAKRYRLGTIGRHTLVEETQYWWHRLRGRDPRRHMSPVGTQGTRAGEPQKKKAGWGDEFWALREVSFDVHAGEVVGIIGGNGAGKSTLLKILTRITEPTAGEAVLRGRVASLLEVGTGFHPELTGRENVYMNGTILGMKKREIDAKLDEIIAFSEIEPFIDTPVKRYSSGMYVRLAFAVAAHLDPEILLIDEVLAVGDAGFQRKCIGKMGDVARSGRTVLFVSHNMAAIQNLCARSLLIEQGRLRADGETPEVIRAYLAGMGEAGSARDLCGATVERSGSGGVRIERAEILSVDGRPTASVPMGAGLRVRIHLRAGSETVRDLALGVGLFNDLGVRVAGVQSAVTGGRRFSVDAGGTLTVDCVLDALNLMPGAYRLHLNVIRHDTARETLDFIPNAVGFTVTQADVYGTGHLPSASAIMYVPVKWETVDPATDPHGKGVGPT